MYTHTLNCLRGNNAARVAGGREETWGHKGSGRAWSQTSTPYNALASNVGPPLEDRTPHFLLEALSGPSAFCPLGQEPKWRTQCLLGAQGQGPVIINPGVLLPHLPAWASFPLEGEAVPCHTQDRALSEPRRQLEGDRPRADAPSWHRRPWGSCPPPGSSLPSSHYLLSHPLVSAGAQRWGVARNRQKKQWSENLISPERKRERKESCEVTGWNQASQG